MLIRFKIPIKYQLFSFSHLDIDRLWWPIGLTDEAQRFPDPIIQLYCRILLEFFPLALGLKPRLRNLAFLCLFLIPHGLFKYFSLQLRNYIISARTSAHVRRKRSLRPTIRIRNRHIELPLTFSLPFRFGFRLIGIEGSVLRIRLKIGTRLGMIELLAELAAAWWHEVTCACPIEVLDWTVEEIFGSDWV